VTEDVKLTASDGTASDYFGHSLSLSGNTALVSAYFDDDNGSASGSAYLFRDLDTASGNITEDVKLTASDGQASSWFGSAVSLSGNTALIGAVYDKNGGISTGSAYVFRDLDTASGNITENVKLTASDGVAGDRFGYSVSQSGNIALVGAVRNDENGEDSGAAYIFRDLDTAASSVTEHAKLTASDGAAGDHFGIAVSLSGNTALVGAYTDDDKGIESGSAYLFQNIDTASGNVSETVKITASDGAAYDNFGVAVSLSGDQFLISAFLGSDSYKGKSYSGSVSSVTTLDMGSTARMISGISFISQDDWIIGQHTDNNQVTLSLGDSATVTAADKSVFIGQNAGSDNNTLIIQGDLTSTNIFIGSTTGNSGNTLQLEAGSTFEVASIYLAAENTLSIAGEYTDAADLLAFLDATELKVQYGSEFFTLLTLENFSSLLKSNFNGQYTNFTVVPEPTSTALFTAILTLIGVITLRRRVG
jgi:hypothetical protein